MVTLEQYSDIQILQGADLAHDIEFETTFGDVNLHDWAAQIAKDRIGTAFTWGNSTATYVALTIVRKNANELTLSLSGANTSKFGDDFEGVWELISKKDSGGDLVRQIQGDVVVSPGIVNTGTNANYTDLTA